MITFKKAIKPLNDEEYEYCFMNNSTHQCIAVAKPNS